MADDNQVKILFRFYSNIFDKEIVETMWATVVDHEKGWYRLDNIPFYAPSVSSEDIVFAEYDNDEEMLTYRSLVEASGNSTIQVILMDDSLEINDIRNIFAQYGCISERVSEKYFCIEVPAETDYKIVKAKLDEMMNLDQLEYAEPCLAEGHQY